MINPYNQDEYTHFYNKLKRYANREASRLFHDAGLRGEAVDTAMDAVENELMTNKNIDNLELFSRGIVRNTLQSSFRNKKLDFDRLIKDSEVRLQKIVSKGKRFPKVRLTSIENSQEKRICLDYWQYGMKQREIAEKSGVSQQYISRVINKYSK